MAGRIRSSFRLGGPLTGVRGSVVGIVLCATGLWGQASYVDPAVCATCHAEIAKTFRLTGMGRSFARPRVEDFKASSNYYHPASDRYYAVIARDGKVYQRRHQIGFGDKETNVVEQSIDYVVGSGNHARTYLHRNGENKLIELPVSWYAENGGSWAMSPGYDRADHQDFRRAIGNDCMFCHNGYPVGKASDTNEPVFGERLPEGIDCQRCHGPGRAHVESKGSAKTIVNPVKLDRDRQLDVCMQCHLETTSLALPNSVRHYERGPYSYQAGEPLGNYATFFDHAPGTGFDDRFEVAHQAYRLRKSACFRESQMTCTTCHDPHQEQVGKQAEAHYVVVCKGCHAAAHSAGMPAGGGNCIDCHMPKRRTEDVVHVVMTDHYIQRRKPDRDLLAPLAEEKTIPREPYRGEVVAYYPAQNADDVYIVLAQVQNGSNLGAGIASLKSAIEKNPKARAEFVYELGSAYATAGKVDEAVRWFDDAVRRRPGYGTALAKLASTLTSAGRFARAVEAGERAIAVQPGNTIVLTNLGNAYLQLGRTDRARMALEQAVKINADLPEAQNLLGLAVMRKGDRAAADSRFREAILSQPDFAEAHNNLANLLAESGDYAQAGYHFEKAIAANAAYAEAHHGYGMLLLLTRSYDKARGELEEAVRLDPKAAQTHADLADVLAAQRRTAEAIEEYRRAIQLKPALTDAYLGLGNLLAKEGKLSEAEAQFRLAIARNPEFHEAHLALGILLASKGAMAEARIHLRKAAESSDPSVRAAALQALR
jgi:tetratricopeptide (TPR) repeat protein